MVGLLEDLIEIGGRPALGALIDERLARLVVSSSNSPRSRSSTVAASKSSSSPNSERAARKRGSKRARRSSTSPRPLSVSEVKTTRRSRSER